MYHWRSDSTSVSAVFSGFKYGNCDGLSRAVPVVLKQLLGSFLTAKLSSLRLLYGHWRSERLSAVTGIVDNSG
jgi:hypothetical protein